MSIYLFETIFILACLVIDIILFFKIKNISFKKSLLIFIFWTLVSIGFFLAIYFNFSKQTAIEFITGYTLERALGLDNLFVFIILFSSLHVPPEGRERVLFWGIIGAIILRVIFIYLGAALIAKFAFIMYIFGLFLILTGVKLLIKKENHNPKESKIINFFKKILPCTNDYEGDKFYVNGLFTPLFLVLLFVAFVDVVFAIDSIPAIFGITSDPFVVLTANFFSLLGFRAMFYLVSHLTNYFYYIKYALSGILIFIGIKMMIMKVYHVPINISLLFIFASITIAIIASIIKVKHSNANQF